MCEEFFRVSEGQCLALYRYLYNGDKVHGRQVEYYITKKTFYEESYYEGQRHGMFKYYNTGANEYFFIYGERATKDEWKKWILIQKLAGVNE